MYHNLRRRFKFAGGVGSEFLATNGIFQGCPLSVVLLNALISVWAKAVETEAGTEGACAEAFADDTGATAQSNESVQQVANVTMEFASLTNQELSEKT